MDAEACVLEVDGRRRPVEYDGENSVLRWRPSPAPPAGVHRYRMVAQDRLGNRSAREGTIRIP
jgi:hypothetical protein